MHTYTETQYKNKRQRRMKVMDNLLCASQASTAICLSMENIVTTQPSSSATGRAIDRHNPIIRDSKRSNRPPCSSLKPHPITPAPLYHQVQKAEKPSADDSGHRKKKEKERKSFSVREGRTGGGDGSRKSVSSLFKLLSEDFGVAARRSIYDKLACGFATPPGSSRYLLSDNAAFLDGYSGCDPVQEKVNVSDTNGDRSSASSKPVSSSLPEKKPSSDQVVVLSVSLNCRGCEGKVRKHLSRMQGVTSFSIDFAAKKVTVTGDVTPLGVLESISKVKNAEFWKPPTPFPSTSNKENLAIKKQS